MNHLTNRLFKKAESNANKSKSDPNLTPDMIQSFNKRKLDDP